MQADGRTDREIDMTKLIISTPNNEICFLFFKVIYHKYAKPY